LREKNIRKVSFVYNKGDFKRWKIKEIFIVFRGGSLAISIYKIKLENLRLTLRFMWLNLAHFLILIRNLFHFPLFQLEKFHPHTLQIFILSLLL
jgi:hypothetical protein